MNQEIEKILRIYCHYAQKYWENLLPTVGAALINRDSLFIGMFSFFFLHGYHLKPIKLVDNIVNESKLKKEEILAKEAIKRLNKATTWAQASMAAAQEKQEYYANQGRSPAPSYAPEKYVYFNLRNVKTDKPVKKLD
jgi:hypothetical protein